MALNGIPEEGIEAEAVILPKVEEKEKAKKEVSRSVLHVVKTVAFLNRSSYNSNKA
jgi:hypothetical protein